MESIDHVIGTFDKQDAVPDSLNAPEAVKRRLPRYYRCLKSLLASGCGRVRSAEFGAMLGLTPSQVRRDLNCFGDFGRQGYGYNVRYLLGKISDLLGAENARRAVILYREEDGVLPTLTPLLSSCHIEAAAFFPIGNEENDVLDTAAAFCRENGLRLAVFCGPHRCADRMAERLNAAGVWAIYNLSSVDIPPREGLLVENVHPDDALRSLCYALHLRESKENEEQRP